MNELVEWEAREFDGTDLLPSAAVEQADLLPAGPEDVPIVGDESVTEEDISPPSLVLLQKSSPAIDEEVPGAVPGKFLHTATNDVFDAPLRTVIIHYSKSARLKVDPTKPEFAGKEDCFSRDGISGDKYGLCEECGLCSKFGENGERPLGARSHVFIALLPQGPTFIRFRRTSYKHGNNFITAWKTGFKQKNLWAHPVILFTKKETGTAPDGSPTSWFELKMAWDQKERTPDVWQRKAYELWQQFDQASSQGRLRVDVGEDLEGDLD